MSEKATITLATGDDPLADDLRVHVEVHDPRLLGHEAEFTLVAQTEVKDGSPVHGEKVLYREKFALRASRDISVPRQKIRAYSYRGRMIDLVVHTRLVVDDSVLFDTKVSQRQALDLGIKAPVSTNSKTIVEPPDDFFFFRNLAAIPAHSQLVTLGLAVVGGLVMLVNAAVGVHDQFVPEPMTWLYSHYGSDGDANSPLAAALAGSGAAGAAIWFLIRHQLRKYMKFHLGKVPHRIRPGDLLEAASLFAGRSRVPLDGVTLRVIASNMECGQYVRGSGSNRRTVSFREPARAVVLYERQVERIPARAPIGKYFTGLVDFDPMFATLYPPFKVSDSHGLDVHWEIQLLHPEFVDQEIVGPGEPFAYEDFLRE